MQIRPLPNRDNKAIISAVGKRSGSVKHCHLQAAGDSFCALHEIIRRLRTGGCVGKGLCEQVEPNGKVLLLNLRELLMRRHRFAAVLSGVSGD